ncbi:uncharacterized protein LOC106959890 isoform X2 [Poecilia latipinna]|uniref:uncharacterized protein LOC106959890 isoform X2 n=1 Tax=Poecilia latipinna TaxID=48699 RepID=UPI00072DA507|nr:PREDICTED: uncharacterized protein LOC106959890 isoform X2 [Poecilia latipinna]
MTCRCHVSELESINMYKNWGQVCTSNRTETGSERASEYITTEWNSRSGWDRAGSEVTRISMQKKGTGSAWVTVWAICSRKGWSQYPKNIYVHKFDVTGIYYNSVESVCLGMGMVSMYIKWGRVGIGTGRSPYRNRVESVSERGGVHIGTGWSQYRNGAESISKQGGVSIETGRSQYRNGAESVSEQGGVSIGTGKSQYRNSAESVSERAESVSERGGVSIETGRSQYRNGAESVSEQGGVSIGTGKSQYRNSAESVSERAESVSERAESVSERAQSVSEQDGVMIRTGRSQYQNREESVSKQGGVRIGMGGVSNYIVTFGFMIL